MTPASPSSEIFRNSSRTRHADLEIGEVAVDDLGRQLHPVVELGDADGVGGLVVERCGGDPDDRIGQELAGLGELRSSTNSRPPHFGQTTRGGKR